MMRVNLLRELSSGEPPTGTPQLSSDRRALKQVLIVLLGLLVASAGAIWLTKPEWVHLDRAASLWNYKGGEAARRDSVQRFEAASQQASHLVDGKQANTVAWLVELEALLAPRNSQGAGTEGAVAFTTISSTPASSSAEGAFLLTGTASAEALSALQEALVLVPGVDLRQSQAQETTENASLFAFRLAGTVAAGDESAHRSEGHEEVAEAGSNASVSSDSPQAPVRNRVIQTASLSAELETLRTVGAEFGITFSIPRVGKPSRQGALTVHTLRMKGLWRLPPVSTDSTLAAAPSGTSGSSEVAPWPPSAISSLRELWAQERHRGSPFAIQRVTVTQKASQQVVFLDILALTP